LASRVTIQDIADALGVSRNTVSKAINNTPGLADATREKILRKAAELGYKQFSYLNMVAAPAPAAPAAQPPLPAGEIALFSRGFVDSSHFAATMLDKFQRELSQMGYVTTMHQLTEEEVKSLTLPPTFRRERTAGIVCVELFHADYARMLGGLDIPLLFVDGPARLDEALPADVLLMDNRQGITQFVGHMLDTGRRRIGFIGPVEHCRSFMERYLSYRNALFTFGGRWEERFCVTGTYQNQEYPADEDYRRYLKEQLAAMEELPDVFLCANDALAVRTMFALRELGVNVPEQVQLCGFDDFPDAKIVSPALTTIHIHSQTMGLAACHLIMSRIREPALNFRTTYVETNLIYRQSAPF
jgi:LacI family transcriptional regulator